MNTSEYNTAIARIKQLQDPSIQPIDVDLAWELSDLMTACARYEADHDLEALIRAEASEWHAFDRADASYSW